ncbi:hypothetical protein B1A99_22340 [Cohnella sp. CIP 111063]|nr:hypothetical protein B1A99_22340 [Cohnella sp. CIP 111063]
MLDAGINRNRQQEDCRDRRQREKRAGIFAGRVKPDRAGPVVIEREQDRQCEQEQDEYEGFLKCKGRRGSRQCRQEDEMAGCIEVKQHRLLERAAQQCDQTAAEQESEQPAVRSREPAIGIGYGGFGAAAFAIGRLPRLQRLRSPLQEKEAE